MTTTIVIIGDSLLAFFLAHFLDQEEGSLTHYKIILITRDEQLIYPAKLTTFLGRMHFAKKRSLLQNVKVLTRQVKQINFKERRITLDNQLLEYDFLFIDQTAVFTAADLAQIATESKRLATYLQAALHQGKDLNAHITVRGRSAWSYQVALALRSDFHRTHQLFQHMRIMVDWPSSQKLANFLGSHGLTKSSKADLTAGLSIAAPTSLLNSTALRQVAVDRRGEVKTNEYSQPVNHSEVLVVGGIGRDFCNLARAESSLARLILSHWRARVNGTHFYVPRLSRPAFVLHAKDGAYVELGSLMSHGLRARAITVLDRRYFNRLTRS